MGLCLGIMSGDGSCGVVNGNDFNIQVCTHQRFAFLDSFCAVAMCAAFR